MKKSIEQLRTGSMPPSTQTNTDTLQTSSGTSTTAVSTLGKRKNASRLTSSQGELNVTETNTSNSSDDEEIVNNWLSSRNPSRRLSIKAAEIPPAIREWYQFYSYPTNVMKLLAPTPNNQWPVGANYNSSK